MSPELPHSIVESKSLILDEFKFDVVDNLGNRIDYFTSLPSVAFVNYTNHYNDSLTRKNTKKIQTQRF